MTLDIIFAVLLVLAVVKGYRKGLILGIFSFLAIIIGLAAAMKLSLVVAGYIGKEVAVSQRWLPVLSFVLVFIVTILLVRLGAKALEKTAELVTLGWLNKLGGILLYVALYTAVFSVLIFYAEKLSLIRPATISNSLFYPYIQPWGPAAINALGVIIPFFRDMFAELSAFFDRVEIAPASS